MQRLKKLRENRGLTQEQLAEQINISQQRISAYENEYATPPTDVLIRYAEFFETSTDYLLAVDRLPREVGEEMSYVLSEEEQILIDEYRVLSDANRKIVRTVASTCYELENGNDGMRQVKTGK